MKKLKKQTSRFFSEAPSADERAAGGAGVFDAGIGAPPPAMKKKSVSYCCILVVHKRF